MAIGVNKEAFWHMTMRDLNVCKDACKIEQEIEDEKLWRAGYYNYYGFNVVMSNFGASLGKKKSNAKYLEKPLLQTQEEQDYEMTEEEELAEIRRMIAAEDRRNAQLKTFGMKQTVIKKKGDKTDG